MGHYPSLDRYREKRQEFDTIVAFVNEMTELNVTLARIKHEPYGDRTLTELDWNAEQTACFFCGIDYEQLQDDRKRLERSYLDGGK